MSTIAVSPGGVSALRKMARDLTDNIEVINSATNELQGTYEEHRAFLGPHAASLGQVIEDVKQAAAEAAEPIDGLSEKVLDMAATYEEFINNDPFSGISGN